jgi:hypothetical protein
MFSLRILIVFLIVACAAESEGQVRFYFQYRGIPFYKGGATDFSVLSGVKLDPNKEIIVGIGLAGNFTPRNIDGDLRFDKNTFSLGFNYYLSRKFYIGADAALSHLQGIVKNNTLNGETLTGKMFLDYQFNVTVVALRRLHFSVATGLVDFTKLAIKTTSNIVEEQKLKPDVALSLRLYVFQIKF